MFNSVIRKSGRFLSRILILSLTLLALFSSTALACTSFAVYAQQPLYGMNFDRPPTDLVFFVSGERPKEGQEDSVRSFHFTWTDGKNGEKVSVAMSGGILIAVQQQSPIGSVTRSPDYLGEKEMYISQILPAVLEMQADQPDISYKDILKKLGKKRFVQEKGAGFHCLIADAKGNAAILEVGEKANKTLPITGEYIVMSNFANTPFKGKAYSKVKGPGANRYIAASKYIEENIEEFGLEQAFETLNRTRQTLTRCSMVFAPEEESVYLSIDKDFEEIWKASLAKMTIETYSGFPEKTIISIPQKGIPASKLTGYQTAGFFKRLFNIALTVVAVAVAALVLYHLLKLVKKIKQAEKTPGEQAPPPEQKTT